MPEPQVPIPDNPDKYEFQYPYILPENDALNVLEKSDLESLTPLETAFVLWMMETGNADAAITRLIHPAIYFNTTTHGARVLMGRPHVRDVLKRIKRECPYLKLYNLDYIAGVIHEEVQYLRYNGRQPRFHGDKATLDMFTGKKSLHEEEMLEVKALQGFLDMLLKMNDAVKGSNGSGTGPESGGTDSGVDRVIAEAHRAIRDREKRIRGEVGGDIEGTPPG